MMDYKKIFIDSIKRKIEYNYSEHTGSFDNIGYGIDNNYTRCMGVSIISICENNPHRHFQFNIIASGLNDDSLAKLKTIAETYKVNIKIYDMEIDEFKKFAVQEYFPTATYFRMVLPALSESGKCLYIDADIICMGKLDEILDADITNYDAIVIHDFYVVARKRERALGLTEGSYFNAGVVMFNFAKWFEKSLVDKMVDVLLKNGAKLEYLDQDALNIIMSGNVKYLDGAYNRINASRDTDAEQKIRDTKLMHFTAHPKPWTILWNYCGDEMLKGIYEKYEAKSPWRDEPLMLPKLYKHKKWYANYLRQEGRYKESLHWYWQYILTKYRR